MQRCSVAQWLQPGSINRCSCVGITAVRGMRIFSAHLALTEHPCCTACLLCCCRCCGFRPHHICPAHHPVHGGLQRQHARVQVVVQCGVYCLLAVGFTCWCGWCSVLNCHHRQHIPLLLISRHSTTLLSLQDSWKAPVNLAHGPNRAPQTPPNTAAARQGQCTSSVSVPAAGKPCMQLASLAWYAP